MLRRRATKEKDQIETNTTTKTESATKSITTNKKEKQLQKLLKNKNASKSIFKNKKKSNNMVLYAMLVGIFGIILYIVITPPVPPSAKPKKQQEERKTSSSESSKATTNKTTKVGQYELLETIPHDPSAFTQGLTYHNGKLYESTGLYGESTVRQLNPKNGSEFLHHHTLQRNLFGEGLTYFKDAEGNDRLLLLTYKNLIGHVYNLELKKQSEFYFKTSTGEGWGVTYDHIQQEFIVSDGSEYLYIWDRDTITEKRRVVVRIRYPSEDNNEMVERPMPLLNELEFWSPTINNETQRFVLANVFYKNYIVVIDLKNFLVVNSLDFGGLYHRDEISQKHDIMNGITILDDYEDEESEEKRKTNNDLHLLLTGKMWPNMFRVKVRPWW